MKSFIWTECLGCPEIGSVAINSFLLTHHNLTLNVFVYADDLPIYPSIIVLYTIPFLTHLSFCSLR